MANSNTLNGNTGSHGQQKKTLAAQLDRLDSVIDALSNGLNEAVADVVRQAVSAAVAQTVEAVLREVLSRPELLRAPAPTPEPASPVPVASPAVVSAPRGPSLPHRLWNWTCGKAAATCNWLWETGGAIVLALSLVKGVVCQKTTQALRLGRGAVLATLGWIWRHPRAVSLAIATGLVVGMAAYLAGPLVSSAAVGVAGSLTSLVPVLRLLGSTQPSDDDE